MRVNPTRRRQGAGLQQREAFAGDEFVLVHHGSARELFEPADLDAEPTSANGIEEYAIE